MSVNGGVLQRLRKGPRTKVDVRKNKIIRVDKNGMEVFDDYFTDSSSPESEFSPLSYKDNSRRSRNIQPQRITGITIPSLSPVTSSNRSSISTHYSGMVLRSSRPSIVGVVNPNNSHAYHVLSSSVKQNSVLQGREQTLVLPPEASLQEIAEIPEVDGNYNVATSSSQMIGVAGTSSAVSTHEMITNDHADEPALVGDGCPSVVTMENIDDAGTTQGDDCAVETTHDDDDGDDGPVEVEHDDNDVGSHLQPPIDVIHLTSGHNSMAIGQNSTTRGRSVTTAEGNSSTSASVTNTLKKKRKKKKRCDMFTDRKIRKKSSIKSQPSEVETSERSLNLSPIHPAQKNSKFAASTPAASKYNAMRFVSETSISEIADEPEPLPGPSTAPCAPSCDPIIEPQSTIPRKKRARKSVTFIQASPVEKRSFTERVPDASTILPSFTTAEPLHYCETTFKNVPRQKRRIVEPEPGDGELRRSKRTKVETLKWYKNERIDYKLDKSGLTVVGIIHPQDSPRQIPRFVKRMARKAEREERNKKAELSVHVPVDKHLLRQNTNVIEVIDHHTNQIVAVPCFFKYNQYEKVSCITKKPATDDDPVVSIKTVRVPGIYSGHVEIRPLQEKKIQSNVSGTMVFLVHKGKVEVTIHESSFIVETKDMFYVMKGNAYGVKNLRNEDAHLVYFCNCPNNNNSIGDDNNKNNTDNGQSSQTKPSRPEPTSGETASNS